MKGVNETMRTLISPKTGKPYRPNTELQQLAQHENYALFQLKGMLSNLVHLRKVLSNASYVGYIEYHINRSIGVIKSRQNSRKVNRGKLK